MKSQQKRDSRYMTAVKKALLTLAAIVVTALLVIGIQAHDYIGILVNAKMEDSKTIENNSEQAMSDLEEKLDELVLPATGEPSPNSAAAETDTEQTTDTGLTQPAQDPQQTEQAEEQKQDDSADVNDTAAAEPVVPNDPPDYAEEIEQHYLVLKELKSSFLFRLEAVVESAKDEFAALPKEERNNERKISIVLSKKDELEALEEECDAKVKSEIKAIRSLLALSGQDTSLADEIQEAYENMKTAKKTEFINKLYS